jgi:hypothetical protein
MSDVWLKNSEIKMKRNKKKKTKFSKNNFPYFLFSIAFFISKNDFTYYKNKFPNCLLNFFPYFLILITFLISKNNFPNCLLNPFPYLLI